MTWFIIYSYKYISKYIYNVIKRYIVWKKGSKPWGFVFEQVAVKVTSHTVFVFIRHHRRLIADEILVIVQYPVYSELLKGALKDFLVLFQHRCQHFVRGDFSPYPGSDVKGLTGVEESWGRSSRLHKRSWAKRSSVKLNTDAGKTHGKVEVYRLQNKSTKSRWWNI